MTDASDLGYEQPEADVLEQRREGGSPDEAGLEPIADLAVEANEADLIEQRQALPEYDDEP